MNATAQLRQGHGHVAAVERCVRATPDTRRLGFRPVWPPTNRTERARSQGKDCERSLPHRQTIARLRDTA